MTSPCPCLPCATKSGPCAWDALRQRAGLLPSVPVPPEDAPKPPQPFNEPKDNEEAEP
jgi:hypothetical protein